MSLGKYVKIPLKRPSNNKLVILHCRTSPSTPKYGKISTLPNFNQFSISLPISFDSFALAFCAGGAGQAAFLWQLA